MSSAHSSITEARLDPAFTFMLSPICLGSTLESIPVGCRPTLHWASSAEPSTKPCRSKKRLLCLAYFREISVRIILPLGLVWQFVKCGANERSQPIKIRSAAILLYLKEHIANSKRLKASILPKKKNILRTVMRIVKCSLESGSFFGFIVFVFLKFGFNETLIYAYFFKFFIFEISSIPLLQHCIVPGCGTNKGISSLNLRICLHPWLKLLS